MDTAPAPQPSASYPRNADATRTRILDAAQQAFSETGYSHTGIREIARRAGISSTLLLRYFGSKAGLFEAALRAAMPVGPTLAWGREDYAARLAAALADAQSQIRPPLMIALASGDPEAAAIAAQVTAELAIGPLADWLGGADGRQRAISIAMLATGYVTYARQLPLAIPAPERAALERWFVGEVGRLVAG